MSSPDLGNTDECYPQAVPAPLLVAERGFDLLSVESVTDHERRVLDTLELAIRPPEFEVEVPVLVVHACGHVDGQLADGRFPVFRGNGGSTSPL